MPRPRRKRHLRFNPKVDYFKPQGVPLKDLQEMELLPEEIEALNMKNVEGLDQETCAQRMNVSQSTFQRILSGAYKKISLALTQGQAIKIQKE